MDTMTRDQIFDKAVYISHSTNSFWKDMNMCVYVYIYVSLNSEDEFCLYNLIKIL